jgi:hypothetical protein
MINQGLISIHHYENHYYQSFLTTINHDQPFLITIDHY